MAERFAPWSLQNFGEVGKVMKYLVKGDFSFLYFVGFCVSLATDKVLCLSSRLTWQDLDSQLS